MEEWDGGGKLPFLPTLSRGSIWGEAAVSSHVIQREYLGHERRMEQTNHQYVDQGNHSTGALSGQQFAPLALSVWVFVRSG